MKLRMLFILVLACCGFFNRTWVSSGSSPAWALVSLAHAHKYSGMTVREILKTKRADIRRAPLPKGAPSWDDILDLKWEDIEAGAKARKLGYNIFHKLLTDGRFDR